MATNYAQKLKRERQSPKGNVLKGIAYGSLRKLGAISDKESKLAKLALSRNKLGAISDRESKMLSSTGWMKKPKK